MHVVRTYRVDLGLFEEVNLEHTLFIKCVRTNDQLAHILTRNVRNDAVAEPHDSSDVRSFSRKPFCCTAFAAHQTVAQKMTEAKCIVKMWDQYSSKLLKSGGSLSDLLSLAQLRNHDFEYTQSKRDLLAEMLCQMKVVRPLGNKGLVRQLI